MYSIYTKMAKSLNSGETEYQLKSAEEMRIKLVKLYQQIELQSAQILQYEPTSQNKDQLKLQRNIRFQAINYLKENSFTLSQLPNSETYFKLKAQRELSLQEELKRLELEQMKQKNELNKRINYKKLQQQQQKQSNKPNITIDNSNGWMPTNIKANLFLDDSDSESQEDTLDLNEPNGDDMDAKSLSSQKRVKSEKEKAIRIQIQLVEKYLDEALKQNKFDEADSLRKNLNELLNTLVDK